MNNDSDGATNSSGDFWCGEALLYGGWAHATMEQAARIHDGTDLDTVCEPSTKTDYIVAKLLTVFPADNEEQEQVRPSLNQLWVNYRQEVSYHRWITNGLIDTRTYLVDNDLCDEVVYGSQGTCAEMQGILRGANYWMYNLPHRKGILPIGYDPLFSDIEQLDSEYSPVVTIKGLSSFLTAAKAAPTSGGCGTRLRGHPLNRNPYPEEYMSQETIERSSVKHFVAQMLDKAATVPNWYAHWLLTAGAPHKLAEELYGGNCE